MRAASPARRFLQSRWRACPGLPALAVATARAQPAFPARPITMVVPLPAGGTADLLCRLAADKAGAALGQQVVVENRPGGAGGRIGAEAVMRSPPDGYMLLCAPQLAFSITHLVFARSAFDTRAMEPVSVLAAYPLILVARSGAPFGNTAGLLAYARANPGKVNYGHQGKGNTGHLLGELLMLEGGFRMTEIPYRGSAPAINDLIAGTIDLVPDYLLANKQSIDAGKLKLIATAGASGSRTTRASPPSRRRCPAFMPIPGWRSPRLPAPRRRSPPGSPMRSRRAFARPTSSRASWRSRPSRSAARPRRCVP